MRRLVRIGMAAALLVALPPALAAQVRFQAGGGISNPVSDLGDMVDSGLQGRAGFSLGVPLFPLSVRLEGEVSRFPRKDFPDGSATLLGGSASVVLSLGGLGISPYLIAGAGQYRVDFSDEFGLGDATTDTGIHGGFGANIGALGLGGWAEIRLVNISRDGGDVRALPVSVGLRF